MAPRPARGGVRAKSVLVPVLPALALLALVALALTIDLELPGEGTGEGAGFGSGSGPGRGSGSGGGSGSGVGPDRGSGSGSGTGEGELDGWVIPCWFGYVISVGGALVISAFAIIPGRKRQWGWVALILLGAAAWALLTWPACGVEVVPRPGPASGGSGSSGGGGGGEGQRAPPVPEIPPIALWVIVIVVLAILVAALLVAWARARGGKGGGAAPPQPAADGDGAALASIGGSAPAPTTPHGAVIQAYVDAVTALARAGYLRHPWETAREFASRAPPAPAPALRELTSLYELARHGRVAPGDATVARARTLAQAVREATRHG